MGGTRERMKGNETRNLLTHLYTLAEDLAKKLVPYRKEEEKGVGVKKRSPSV